MPRATTAGVQRPRISIDVRPELRRHLRLAAARRDMSVGQFVREALEERIKADLGRDADGVLVLSAVGDPVLAELWDNDRDAAYDRL